MNAINTEQAFAPGKAVWLEASRQPLGGLAIGDIITGTLSATDGKKSTVMMDNGSGFQIDAKSVVAEIGEKISFEVADVNANSVVMRQINEEKREEEPLENAAEADERLRGWVKGAVLPITGAAFASSKIMRETAAEKEIQIRNAIDKIKRDIMFSMNNVNAEAAKLLAESGVSIDNVTIGALTAAVKSAVRTLRSEAGAEEVAAALEEYAGSGRVKGINEIASALISEGLPVTEPNISALEGAVIKAEETGEMGVPEKISFLRRERETTIGNLFSAAHSSGSAHKPREMPDKEWEELLPGVRRYFQTAGITETAANLDAARLLVANDIPVEKDGIEFINGKLKRREASEIIKSAAKNMAEGKSPLSVNIYRNENIVALDSQALFEDYKNIIKALPEITDEAIEAVSNSGAPVTIEALIAAGAVKSTGRNAEGKHISERIKLEEIRLRLTLTAASQMARAGVSIAPMELQGAIDALRALEDKNNAAALEITAAGQTQENLREMSRRGEALRGLANIRDAVKRDVILGEIDFNAQRLHEANAALERYEASGTSPNAKFGDSVEKALKHVENLLETLGIAALPENVRAARSLIRTDTDVTRENIEAVKAVNNKIDYVTQNMHPLISAHMLKDAFNPLAAHIDEVIAYIEKYNELYGEPPVEAAERAIFNMDKNGELSRDERSALIGMFRAVSAINGNETASAAIIAKSGKSLSLENLLESSEYFRKSKGRRSVIDRVVDENEGGREIVFAGESIRKQLERAYARSVSELSEEGVSEETAEKAAQESMLGQTEGGMELLRELAFRETELNSLNINTAYNLRYSIARFAESLKDGGALSYLKALGGELQTGDIRELMDNMRGFLEENAENEAVLNASESAAFSVLKEDLRSLANISSRQLAWMLEMNLPLSIGNLKTVRGLSGERGYLGKRLEELERLANAVTGEGIGAEIPDTGLESLINGGSPIEILEGISRRASELIDMAGDSDSPEKLELLDKATIIENASKLLEKTGGRGGHSQIPIKLRDSIGSLNVYVLNEDADAASMSAYIQLEFPELGLIQGNIRIEGGFADISIGAEADGAAKYLEENAEMLDASLMELGLSGYKVSFGKKEGAELFSAEPFFGQGRREPQTDDGKAVDIKL